ncbi:23588_t:CDS:1, partial [Gigaspora rosea]
DVTTLTELKASIKVRGQYFSFLEMGKGFNIASVLRPMLWSIKEEERLVYAYSWNNSLDLYYA